MAIFEQAFGKVYTNSRSQGGRYIADPEKVLADSKRENTMEIELKIPDHISEHLRKGWDDLPRRALEALAAEGYRAGLITAGQVQQMLGLKSRWDTDAFLKAHRCYLNYTEEDLARDLAAIRKAR